MRETAQNSFSFIMDVWNIRIRLVLMYVDILWWNFIAHREDTSRETYLPMNIYTPGDILGDL